MTTTQGNQNHHTPIAPAVHTGRKPVVSRVLSGLGGLVTRLRAFNAAQVEAQERLWLLNRPWEEDMLHWVYDGQKWQLHGHLPPSSRRRHSVTPGGWCPGLTRHAEVEN